MKYYAVIDTNVIVSSMLKHNSIPGKVVDLIFSKTIIPLLNDEIINEYYEVLMRNMFGFDKNQIENTIREIKISGIFLEKEQVLEDFIDSDDIVFYEIVMSARNTMDAYLITGDKKHYPIKSFVVTPREIIEIIEKDNR